MGLWGDGVEDQNGLVLIVILIVLVLVVVFLVVLEFKSEIRILKFETNPKLENPNAANCRGGL
jgi:hypothetical protein